MKIKMRYDCERDASLWFKIIWGIVGACIIPGMISALITKNFSFWNFGFGFCAFFGFGLLLTLVYIPTYKSDKKIQNDILKLKSSGKIAKGKIINYSFDNHRRGSSGDYTYDTYYYITVTYFDEILNKENTITTPNLTFNPQSDLGSFDCTVYYSDKEYYVTDFVPREKEQENIWGKEIDTLEKDEMKKVIVFITIFMILFIAVTVIGLLSSFGILKIF